MKVRNVMHKGMTCVELSSPVGEIAKHMRDDNVGAIAVCAESKLVGIVTDRDITCRAVADSRDLAQMTAQDLMTKKVFCCSPDDDIAVAIKTMETKKVRRLVVTDREKAIVGILSLGDVSHKATRKRGGEVLRAVSAHHR